MSVGELEMAVVQLERLLLLEYCNSDSCYIEDKPEQLQALEAVLWKRSLESAVAVLAAFVVACKSVVAVAVANIELARVAVDTGIYLPLHS